MWAKAKVYCLLRSHFRRYLHTKANIGKKGACEHGPIRQDPGRWDPSLSPPPSAHAQGQVGQSPEWLSFRLRAWAPPL